MADFRNRFKRIGYDRADADVNRALRSQRRDEDRRDARTEHFGLRRNLAGHDDTLEQEEPECDQEKETEVQVQKRLLQLEKWREERNRKRLLEKKKAKPVFKVGVVHHRVYSPPTNKEPAPVPPPKLCKTKEISQTESVPKRVTRATEKRLALKAVTNQQKKENLRRKREKKPEIFSSSQVKNEAPPKPFAPLDHQFKAPMGLTSLPMFGQPETAKIHSNFKFVDSPTEASYIESPKVLALDRSEVIFPPSMNNHSFILAKSSTKMSSLRNSLLHKKVSKNLEANFEQDLTNNSSIESVILKMSSDDQETLDDQENIHTSDSRFSDATKYFIRRRSSRVLTPTEMNVDTETTEENNQEDKTLISSSSRRSKRYSVVPDTIDEEKVKDNEDESKANLLETSDSESTEKKSSARKQSARKITKSNCKSSDSSQDRQDEIVDQASPMDTSENIKVKSDTRKSNKLVNTDKVQGESISDSPAELKRSSRNSMSTEPASEKPSSKRRSRVLNKPEEETEQELNIEFLKPKSMKKKHLLDLTLSDDFRNSNRFTEIVPTVPDQSLIKFSPRRSVRNQAEAVKTLPSASAAQTFSPGNRVTYSLVKLSPLKIPVSTSLENIKEGESPKDVGQNFSLNVSLPKSTSPERPLAHFSPYVVTSRGKSSSRKEAQKRRFSQPVMNHEELPTKETIMEKLNISVEEEERTAQYYKHILNQEIERLTDCCNSWDKIKESGEVPEDIHYQIQAAIGHTNLLIRKKFERFRGLVSDCETGKGEMLVRCKDLQGFWEMMYREIKDCDNKFNKLQSLKENNWVDNEPEPKEEEEKKKKKVVKKPALKKKPAAASKPSSLRAHILAARKKKMEENGGDVDIKDPINAISEVKEGEKKVPTPKISGRTSTPKSSKSCLRKVITNSPGRKSVPSPLIAMKISKKLKTPEIHMDESIIYINSDRTPAKGILKSVKDETLTGAKSANKVFFKEQHMEVQEFDSTRGITEISSDDDSDLRKEPTERKLNFEGDSFNGSHIESEQANEMEVNFDNDGLTAVPSHIVRNQNPILSLSPLNVISKNSPLNIPKIKISEASPLISISPLSLNDTNRKSLSAKKRSVKSKKQIKFRGDTDEKTPPNKSSSFPIRVTPKPKKTRKSVQETDDKTSNMEIDDNESPENSPSVNEESQQDKVEFYLNSEGIICQRIIESKKKTPKLKRCNSEKSDGNSKSTFMNLDIGSHINSRLRTKLSHSTNVDMKTPELMADNFAQRTANSSTPRVRKPISKKSDGDKTPTENVTPKVSSRTPRALKNQKNSNLVSNTQKNEQTPRSKSLNAKKTPSKNELGRAQTDTFTPSSSRRNLRVTRLSTKN